MFSESSDLRSEGGVWIRSEGGREAECRLSDLLGDGPRREHGPARQQHFQRDLASVSVIRAPVHDPKQIAKASSPSSPTPRSLVSSSNAIRPFLKSNFRAAVSNSPSDLGWILWEREKGGV